MPASVPRFLRWVGTLLMLGTPGVSVAKGPHVPAKDAWPRRLVDVPSPQLDFQMERTPGTYFRLTISPGVTPTRAQTSCALTAPKAKAAFNGVRLIRMRGLYRGGDLVYNRDCLVEFGFPPEPAEIARGVRPERASGTALPPAAITGASASVRVEDDSAVWTWEIPEAFLPRRLAIVSPSNRAIAPGQRVVLDWSPSGDRLPTEIAVDIVAPGGAARSGLAATVTGSRISFTVPPDLLPAIAGPATIALHPAAEILPAATSCPVAKCSVTLVYEIPSIVTQLVR